MNPLTPRQLEVLTLAHNGLSNAQIAARLVIEVGTVKQHLHSVYARLRVSGRAPYGGRLMACAIVFVEAK